MTQRPKPGVFEYRCRAWSYLLFWLAPAILLAFAGGILYMMEIRGAVIYFLLALPFPFIGLFFIPLLTFTADATGLTIARTTRSGFLTQRTHFPTGTIRGILFREAEVTDSDGPVMEYYLEVLTTDGKQTKIREQRLAPFDRSLGRNLAEHLGVEYLEELEAE